jgi:hypothetical protein
MTVNELIGYLTSLADHGKGNATVKVANKGWNPITDCEDITNAVLLEWKDAESTVVLQY